MKQKKQISESVKAWHKNVGVSDITKEKLRKSNTGKKHSLDSIQIMVISAVNRKRYICPLCFKLNLDGGNFNQHMKRIHNWESDKCKEFKINS